MRAYSRKYKCGRCSALHGSRWDAEECCKPGVDVVYVCDSCDEQFDREREAKSHEHEGVPAWVEGSQCLCGAHVVQEDYEQSMLLGSLVRCQRCREKLFAGMPSGEAVRQSFTERGIETN